MLSFMFSLYHSNHRIIIIYTLIFYALSLSSQGMTLKGVRFLSAAPGFEEPACELDLLPDTPSYYIVKELFNADTLTSRGTELTFYNYGDTRLAIYSDPNTTTYADKIIKYQRISDTFSIQTTTRYGRQEPEFDSTLVWWKKGIIVHAIVVRYDGVRIDYAYMYDHGKLVHATIQHSRDGKTEINYTYKEGLLSKIVYRSPDLESETDFQYTDTLIITTCVSKEKSSVWIIKSTSTLDNMGRKLSLNVYMQRKEDPERLYQSEDYSYYFNGEFRQTFTQHSPNMVSIKEFRPGYLPTERWTWEGSDQVLLKKYMPL